MKVLFLKSNSLRTNLRIELLKLHITMDCEQILKREESMIACQNKRIKLYVEVQVDISTNETDK
jgi:hypothetical protein